MNLLATIQIFLTSIGIGTMVIVVIRIITQLVVLAREVLSTYKTTLEIRKLLNEETERVRTIVTANEQELKRYRRRPDNIDFELGLNVPLPSASFEDTAETRHRVMELQESTHSAVVRFE